MRPTPRQPPHRRSLPPLLGRVPAAHWALLCSLLLALSPLFFGSRAHAADAAAEDWKADWAVLPGFSLDVDTSGYSFPTAIAFVPNPGPDPKDPLYFVTELRGTVKVVTNDRSVHVFAEDFFHLEPMPHVEEYGRFPEIGMAGIALDAKRGYVFVSFTYNDESGTIRSNVMRFQCETQRFCLRPTGSVAFTDIFADQVADSSHMIGPMMVVGEHLYVNIGDAHVPVLTQEIQATPGKILRMTLDGDPIPDNPFYRDGDRKKPENYVWASGFRNPFGLEFVDGRMFVTDVGPSVDRFVEVERGENYGYDGTDWSISSHADVSFSPSVSPVQLVYVPESYAPLPPKYRDAFFLATSGDQLQMGPSSHGDKAILMIRWDFARDRVIGRPVQAVVYRSDRGLMPVGLGRGPDGLYMVTLAPNPEMTSSIIRIYESAANPHPYVIGRAAALFESMGCRGCHLGRPDSVGPPIDPETLSSRLLGRLDSSEYNKRSWAIDSIEEEPMRSYREARRQVRQAEGQEKVRLWLMYRLLEPRFDMPEAVMPNLGLSPDDAALIASLLVKTPEAQGPLEQLRLYLTRRIPYPRQRHLLGFLAAGLAVGFMLGGSGVLVVLALRRRGGRER